MSEKHVFFGKFCIEQKDGTEEYTVSEMPMSDKERDALAGIVRCRNCKQFAREVWGANTVNVCRLHAHVVPISPNGFCAWGERKEDE